MDRSKRHPLVASAAPGKPMSLDSYEHKFENDYWGNLSGKDPYKLERRQVFREPDSPSWRAFMAGNEEKALWHIELQRPHWMARAQRSRDIGLTMRRVRVVEFPLTPYVHWELYALQALAECGAPTRIVLSHQVARFEAHAPLPELITLGIEVMYRVTYDHEGTVTGGVRYTDTRAIHEARLFIQGLYDQGEDMEKFFLREIAPLPFPTPARES
jgi:hypothetical protein